MERRLTVSGAFILPCPLLLSPAPSPRAPTPPRQNTGDQFSTASWWPPFPVISPPLTTGSPGSGGSCIGSRPGVLALSSTGPSAGLFSPGPNSWRGKPLLVTRTVRRPGWGGGQSLTWLCWALTHTCNFQSSHQSALASAVPSLLLPNVKLCLTPEPVHRLVFLPGCSAQSLFTYVTPIHSRTSPPSRSLPSQLYLFSSQQLSQFENHLINLSVGLIFVFLSKL